MHNADRPSLIFLEFKPLRGYFVELGITLIRVAGMRLNILSTSFTHTDIPEDDVQM